MHIEEQIQAFEDVGLWCIVFGIQKKENEEEEEERVLALSFTLQNFTLKVQ